MKEQRLVEGPLCVCVFASHRQYEEKRTTTAWRRRSIIHDCRKNHKTVSKKN
jgi:hypothetical protein